jgi:hypothetical protein
MKPTSSFACFALIGMATLASAAHADANLDCDAYAGAAVAQQGRNIALGCGYGGGGWSADYDGHRTWCLQGNVQMADLTREDGGRAGALEICLAKTQACDAYAAVALRQSGLNEATGCGQTGGRWSPDVAGHRAWCMAVPPEASRAEMELRSTILQSCRAKTGEEGDLAGLDLQSALQQQQQALQLLSNIAKAMHDSDMSVIRKIGG